MNFSKLYCLLIIPSFVILLVASFDEIDDNDEVVEHQSGELNKKDIIITFKNNTDSIILKYNTATFPTRAEKIRAFRTELMEHSNQLHSGIIGFLVATLLCAWKQLYVTAQLCLTLCIDGLPIFDIILRRFSHIILSIENAIIIPIPIINPTSVSRPTGVVTGINQTGAPTVWLCTENKTKPNVTGKGVVVANIDTGVRWSHETLRRNFLGACNDGWLDPCSGTLCPGDLHGHGTHTMGTICGNPNIGMAPDARWIACRGCFKFGCPSCCLLECAFWMLCPDVHRNGTAICENTPNVISNSWGGNGGSGFFQAALDCFKNCGIIPVFAAGNSGPGCGTCGSPGDNNKTCPVGALNFKADCIANFSSRQRTEECRSFYPEEDPCPCLSAPGTDVISAGKNNDTAYVQMSGTSMATPHVAGAVALLLSININLTYEQVFCLLKSTACPLTCIVNGTLKVICVGNNCVNNVAGYGVINLIAAFDKWTAGKKHCIGINLNSTCLEQREKFHCETFEKCLARLNTTEPGARPPKPIKTVGCDCRIRVGFSSWCYRSIDKTQSDNTAIFTPINMCCKA